MSLNSMGLGFVFTAKDLASDKISDLERRFATLDQRVGLGASRMQSAFTQLGTGLAIFTAGTAPMGAALGLANAAGRFEQSIAAVGAVSGATSAELEGLRDAAISAGVATQFSPTQASLGLRELAQAGFTTRESIDLLLPALDLAAGSLGELSPQQAAGLASQAMKAFGLSTSEAAISVDRMLQAVNVFALGASELPLALGTASRGAQALHQSLSETLISLGLVKNIIPGVERASTAAAVAMERLADPEAQERLRGLGVRVVDAAGRFRAFLDVLGDMAPVLDRMSESNRSAFLLKTFGREALGGVNAILTQLTTGIRTTTGATVQGADAIGYLRQQFEQAGGTAAQFRDKMLSTFEGQKQLLKGSLETLVISLGEPFAQVLRPVVAAVVTAVNTLLEAVRNLPGPVKRAFALVTVALGGVVALVGAALAAKAAFAIFALGLQVAGLSLASLLGLILPVIGGLAMVGAVVAGFVLAFRANLGGLADFVHRLGDRIVLAFRGLVQLFEQGGFSGAVRAELARADNGGLKEFLIRIYQFVYRVQRLLEGIGEGFSLAIDAARPTFEAFVNALSRLGAAFGRVALGAAGAAAAVPSERFAAFGRVVGTIAGVLVDVFVGAVTLVIDAASTLLDVFRNAMAPLAGLFSGLRDAVGRVFEELGKLGAALGFSSAEGQRAGGVFDALRTAMQFVGFVMGNVAGAVIGATAAMVKFVLVQVASLVGAFRSLVRFVGSVIDFFGALVTGSWAEVWVGFKKVVLNTLNFLAQTLLAFVETITSLVDSIAEVFGADLGASDAIRRLRREIETGLTGGVEEVTAGVKVTPVGMPPVSPASSATVPMPAVAALQLRPAQPFPQSVAQPSPAPPVVVHLQVDGATLATAVHGADRDNATRSFSPLPTY
ncbi:MAG: phage tail tape measure protein [Myxococcales bacterium]|nr:phage tail tape measure protein [Myxococcales bacterium]